MAASISDWNELLPELLEKILGMVNDRETALSAKLVNSLWKAEMEKQMEKACLATWTQWKSPRVSNPSPTAAFSKVLIWKNDEEPVATASVGDTKGQTLIKSNCNPFPTKSVDLIWSSTRQFGRNADLIPAKAFFERHGAKVNNVHLRGAFSSNEVHGFLSWFPNLKGILIPLELGLGRDSAFSKATPLPALLKLEHLDFCKLLPTKQSRQFFHGIMDTYGANLVSLYLDGSNMFSLKENKKMSSEETPKLQPRYQKLAYLKVVNPGGSFFKSSASFPQLTHLVVTQMEAPISFKGLRVIMDFIDKCAATLVHLNLDVILGELKNPDFGVLQKNPPQIFPKLTSFAVRFPIGALDDALLLKRAFMSRFPALTRLELHCYPDSFAQFFGIQIDDVFISRFKAGVVADQFFNCAPMLQKVSAYHLDGLGRASELFTITKDS